MYVGQVFRRNAEMWPNKDAFVCDGARRTFSEFNTRIKRLIWALSAAGLAKGERLAILSQNSIAVLEVCGAAEKGGFVAVPLNYRLAPPELEFILQDCGARVLFFSEDFASTVQSLRPRLSGDQQYVSLGPSLPWAPSYETFLDTGSSDEPAREVAESDVLYLLYTSGTTGRPKGVIHTHGNVLEQIKIGLIEQGLNHHDRFLVPMPFYHIGGKGRSMVHTYRGCTVVIMSRFDPELALELIQSARITVALMAPTMVDAVLDVLDKRTYDVSSLHTIIYSASAMPPSILRRGMTVFGHIFAQIYGMTETGTTTYFRKEDHRPDGTPEEVARLASCGLPAIDVEVKVVRENGTPVQPGEMGELITRARSVTPGYWNRPQETAEAIRDGWLYTGDMARIDREGFIYIVDRKKDIIVSGGENIAAREVEDALLLHRAVAEAAVLGVPDERWGESVLAVVALKPGMSAMEGDLINHCREHIASYKKPRYVQFVEALPRNANGKVIKAELKQRFRAATPTDGSGPV